MKQLRSNVVLIKVTNTMHVCNTLTEISKLIDKSVVQLSRYKSDTLVYDTPKYTIWFDCEVHNGRYKGQKVSILNKGKLSKVVPIKTELFEKIEITKMCNNSEPELSKDRIQEMVRRNEEKVRLMKEKSK